MSKMLWMCWDGGGNLNPSLGVARVLRERGHKITFYGRPEMLPRVRAAGFDAVELKEAGTLIDAYPAGPLRTVGAYLTSPRVSEEIRAIVDREKPDLVVVDCMFPAALVEAKNFSCPTAVMLHTFFHRMEGGWKEMTEKLNAMRQKAGFSALPSLHDLWAAQDRLIVNTVEALDRPVSALANGNLRHAAPVLEQEPRTVDVELPWKDDDRRPLVLVSFSTVTEQRMPDSWQRALDALATLPVRVIGTTGGLVDPAELKVPANAKVVKFASHEALMKRVTLVFTHGGHGTAMRALRNAKPMVLMPALATDQPVMAAAVEEWGAGRALARDASVDQIRTAVADVLANPSFAENAKRLSAQLAGVDGALSSATLVEELLTPAKI